MLWSGRDHSEKDLFLLPLNRFPQASAGAARLRKSSGGGCGLALTPHFNSSHHIIPRDYPFSSLSPNISAFFPAVSRLQVPDPWCSAVVTSPGSATPGTHAVRSQPLGGAARAPQSASAPRDCSSTVAYFITVRQPPGTRERRRILYLKIYSVSFSKQHVPMPTTPLLPGSHPGLPAWVTRFMSIKPLQIP
jgi:hypothetical protein